METVRRARPDRSRRQKQSRNRPEPAMHERTKSDQRRQAPTGALDR